MKRTEEKTGKGTGRSTGNNRGASRCYTAVLPCFSLETKEENTNFNKILKDSQVFSLPESCEKGY